MRTTKLIQSNMNILRHFLQATHTRTLFVFMLFVVLCESARADALIVEPRFYVDLIGYRDSVDGQGAGFVQNPNGIFNTHTDGLANDAGHNHGGNLHSGLNLRGAEFSVHAIYGDHWDARFNLMTDGRTIALEEAWLRARSAAGGSLKFGKFLSAVGWQNALHPHAWDFVDQPLPYQLLLAGGLGGNGLQASWRVQSPRWHGQIGAEFLSSGNEAVAAALSNPTRFTTSQGTQITVPFAERPAWPTVHTIFARLGTSLRTQETLGANVGWIHGRQHQELHQYHPGINDADHALQGNTDTWVAGLRYAYDPNLSQYGRWDVQAEYFYQRKDLTLNFHQTKPWNIGQPRALAVDGYYLQARYGVAPRWTIGLRFDVAGHLHEARRDASPAFCAAPYQSMPCPRQNSVFEGLSRRTALIEWRLDARQSVRLQFSRVHSPVAPDVNQDGRMEAVNQHFNQAFLEYRLALGAAPKPRAHRE